MIKFLKYFLPSALFGVSLCFVSMERSAEADLTGRKSFFYALDRKLNKNDQSLGEIYAAARSEIYREKLKNRLSDNYLKNFESPEDELIRLLERHQSKYHPRGNNEDAMIIYKLASLETQKSLDYLTDLICSRGRSSEFASYAMVYTYIIKPNKESINYLKSPNPSKDEKKIEKLKKRPDILQRLLKEIDPIDVSRYGDSEKNSNIIKIMAATQYKPAQRVLISIASSEYYTDYAIEALYSFPNSATVRFLTEKALKSREKNDYLFLTYASHAIELANRANMRDYACGYLLPDIFEVTYGVESLELEKKFLLKQCGLRGNEKFY